MKKKLHILTTCLILLLINCREEDLSQQENPIVSTQRASKVTSGIYESEMPYNLNVVYFIPSDVSARPDYERRVSETLLHAQEYYRQMMYNWGYGNRTFGLLKNPATNRIKINIINGALPISSYPYSSGNQILSEVNAWFANHPADKTSDHNVIITATPSINTEIPYYGLGRNFFVGDNEDSDVQYFNENSARGNQAKAYMGGFLHELGHGLGLPHDALAKSLTNVAGYGTSLMSWGNQTYGYSSTILTKASCAILNNTQLFSTSAKPTGYFYTGSNGFKITSINHSYINGRINIWGTYSVDAPINAINSYFIPKDSYYHAVSGSSNTDGTNTFSTYVDVSDLYFTEKTYSLVLQAQFVNGNSNWVTFPFTFKNDIPDLNFPVNKDNWTVSSSSQYAAYPASLAIDDNINTYWHTNYSAGSVQTDPIAGQPQNFPYYFDINMGAIRGISGLSFTQHQGLVRTAKTTVIYTRATTNEGWKHQGTFNLTNTIDKQYTAFAQKENCRYVRIVFYSSHDAQPYIAMPEIGAYE